MSGPIIFGKRQSDVLGDIGTALLQVKNNRGLALTDMAGVMGRCDDMIAKYIAGETEMGVIAWERAKAEWPELVSLIEETAADRAAKARQRTLDLELTRQRSAAA